MLLTGEPGAPRALPHEENSAPDSPGPRMPLNAEPGAPPGEVWRGRDFHQILFVERRRLGLFPGKGTGPGFSFRRSSLRLYTGSRSEMGRRINSLRRRSVSYTWRSFRIVFYSTSSLAHFLAVHSACAGAVFRAHGAHFASHFTVHRRSLTFSWGFPCAGALFHAHAVHGIHFASCCIQIS